MRFVLLLIQRIQFGVTSSSASFIQFLQSSISLLLLQNVIYYDVPGILAKVRGESTQYLHLRDTCEQSLTNQLRTQVLGFKFIHFPSLLLAMG